MATDQIFVYTMNQGSAAGVPRGAWSRYIFPFTVEHFAQMENILYMRHGDDVSFVDTDALNDDGVNFTSIIQWHWLPFGSPGVNKNLVGFDIVCEEGQGTIEIGYDQTQSGYWTTPYTVGPDTVPGQIVAIPVQAPTMAVRLTFLSGQEWQWNALQLHFDDMRPGA